jgi:hypothetical protein
MQDVQNIPNPDVNSRDVEDDLGSHAGIKPNPRSDADDIERPDEDDTIPVPPDQEPSYPVEEPPGRDGPPVGDVDDSPKRIADE